MVALGQKGTLLEPGAGGPGGGLVPAVYEPGVVQKLFEPIGVADLFASSPTTGSQVRYVVEGTATSGASGVAEGGTKPESTLVYSEVAEPVKKIATVLPISDEMLEDAPSIQSYLNSRLGLGEQRAGPGELAMIPAVREAIRGPDAGEAASAGSELANVPRVWAFPGVDGALVLGRPPWAARRLARMQHGSANPGGGVGGVPGVSAPLEVG
jgi:hypothetical protein